MSPVLSLVVFPTIDWLRPTSEQGTWQLVVHIFLGFFGRLAIGGQNKLQQVNTCAVQSLHSGIFYPKCVFPAVVWSFYVWAPRDVFWRGQLTMLLPSSLFELAFSCVQDTHNPQLWTVISDRAPECSCSSTDTGSRALFWLPNILKQVCWGRCSGPSAPGLGHGTPGSIGQESLSQGNESSFESSPAHSSTRIIGGALL